MRENYTPDVRHIFDIGIRIYESHPDADIRRREFYVATSHYWAAAPSSRIGWMTLHRHRNGHRWITGLSP